VFWIQLSTFGLFNLLILAMLAQRLPVSSIAFASGQHAGGGKGDYSVWRLIADIEAENAELDTAGQNRATGRKFPEIPPRFPESDPDGLVHADEPTGRHHLRAGHGPVQPTEEARAAAYAIPSYDDSYYTPDVFGAGTGALSPPGEVVVEDWMVGSGVASR
jgi:hypothetical protein